MAGRAVVPGTARGRVWNPLPRPSRARRDVYGHSACTHPRAGESLSLERRDRADDEFDAGRCLSDLAPPKSSWSYATDTPAAH